MVEIVKAYCNKCCGERRHEVLHCEKTTWSEDVDEYHSIDGGDIYEMIKCCGCENVALRHQSWFSEDTDEQGRPAVQTNYYPPATYRQEPKWLTELFWVLPIDGNFVGDLLKEIYVALRNDSRRLAVMGIRALIEQVMIDKVGDQGTFKNNLNEFETKGFISKSQRAVLEPVLEAGHAAIHRAFNPSKDDLIALIDITENIIESIYVNEKRAKEIKKNVPTKPGKKAKGA